jgi:uncharacterized protein YdhG (YjbR/CyaY superfamily)
MRMQSDSGPRDIDEYIAGFDAHVRVVLEDVRTSIRKAAPDATETIKYRIPTFVQNGNLVHFAAFKNHVGFYPAPSGIARFKDELSPYKWAKGSVQFPFDRPVPLQLIEKIVRFRVSEAKSTNPTKRRK